MNPSCPLGINQFDYARRKIRLETQKAAQESQDKENIDDSPVSTYCTTNTFGFPSQLST